MAALMSSRPDQSYLKGSGTGHETAIALAIARAKDLVLIDCNHFASVQDMSDIAICPIPSADSPSDVAMRQLAHQVSR